MEVAWKHAPVSNSSIPVNVVSLRERTCVVIRLINIRAQQQLLNNKPVSFEGVRSSRELWFPNFWVAAHSKLSLASERNHVLLQRVYRVKVKLFLKLYQVILQYI